MAKKKKKSTKKRTARTDFARVSVVKEYLAAHGYRTSAGAVEILNEEIHRILDMAASRAEASGRVTVNGSDI